MRTKRKVTIQAVLAAGVLALASTGVAASWTTAGKVLAIYAGYAGTGRVEVHGLQNAAGCTFSASAFENSWTSPEPIQSLVTSAFLSGKKLRCYVDGCVGAYQKASSVISNRST